MKRAMLIVLITFAFVSVSAGFSDVSASAKNEMTLRGTVYDLNVIDNYKIPKDQVASDFADRFYLKGDIATVSETNGFTSYGIKNGNLDIMINEQFCSELYNQPDPTEWHVIADKTRTVDSKEFLQSINTGAVIVQTSKDGKTWINSDYETDFYANMNVMNQRSLGDNTVNSFYRATRIQLINGCYYRILVAYKLQRELDSSQMLFVTVKQVEEKERIEVYKFYAYDLTANQEETMSTQNAYEFSDVYRVDNQNGFDNPRLIKSDDPHIDWSVGKFYVSGYTDVRMDNGVPMFLKVPGDRVALWFNLEQELDKCNGKTDIKVDYIDSGSDIYFGTPKIKDFGRGTLIIRKTDKENKKERQIYTNYLEASATVGANTRVDLFEEGDYEIALDYQLHYDEPFVFGKTAAKTLTYRIFFKFKVRNGDVSAFLRDIDTNQFIINANVAEHGFYIDVAKSQYLTMSIKREVPTDSFDGLIEDTKFSGVAKEGRKYNDEGIYTVTIKNPATGDSITKRVYVGNRDIFLAHMKTGLSISEINERIAAGASIDISGQIIDPKPIDVIESSQDSEKDSAESPALSNMPTILAETDSPISTSTQTSNSPEVVSSLKTENPDVTKDSVQKANEQAQNSSNETVIFAIVVVLIAFAWFSIKKKRLAEK